MDGDIAIHNKHAEKRRIIAAVLLLTLLIACVNLFFVNKYDQAAYGYNGSSSIVMEVSTKRVLYGKNINQRLPMASTTKIMTGLAVLENSKLDEVVTIPRKAVGVEGSSIYLKEGEKLTVKELLYGLMLRSGNDAATALAIHTGKSVEGFVKMMNDKALSLGLKNTHFTNPHGLHNQNHFTSAYDLAYISATAMQNPVFAEIVGTKFITIGGMDGNRYLYNKNKLLKSYPGATGVKTGFTKKAGRCLVASSKRNGMEVIAVTLNCGPMFEECSRLMDKAHSEFEMANIAKSGQTLAEIQVLKGKKDKARLCVKEDIYVPVKKGGSEKLEYKLKISDSVKAPVKKDRYVGEMEVYLEDYLLFSKKIYTIEDVKKKGAIDYLKDFFR